MFEVGKKYYQCHVDYSRSPAEPVVKTLVYLGYGESDINSESCEKPYHFYQFANFGQDFPAVLVPSRDRLANYLSFEEFLSSLKFVIEDLVTHEGLVLKKPFEMKSIGNSRDAPPANE